MHTPVHIVRWLKNQGVLATVLLCALMVLSACGDESSPGAETEDEGRRFVTERNPTTEPTEVVAATPQAEMVMPTMIPTISTQDLLLARGAPKVIYLLNDDVLTAYDADLRTFTPVLIPTDVQVIDFTSSPTGDRVGVLGVAENRVGVHFFGADGAPLGEPVAVSIAARLQNAASPIASPVATPTASAPPALNIDWIPQGDGVVVSGPGVLQRVSMNGSVMPVSRTGATGTVVNAVWSPMDSQVVIQTELTNGDQAVFVLDSGHDEVSELDVLHDSSGQSITNLQWLPTGLGLVMVAGTIDDGLVMNGQLYVYRFGDEVPMLIATSGQGGPAATITHAVVSPDGRSVAYAIMVRDLDEWHLHSLWVRPLRGGPAISMPLTNNSPITALYWSSEGLVWQQDSGALTVVDGDLQSRPLGQEPAATPVASAVASPIASPIATPVGEATPRG